MESQAPKTNKISSPNANTKKCHGAGKRGRFFPALEPARQGKHSVTGKNDTTGGGRMKKKINTLNAIFQGIMTGTKIQQYFTTKT